jgi:hypothetical protein
LFIPKTNSLILKNSLFTTNQNDLWHAVKAVKKSVSKVSKGAKFSEGLSWSQQLADKVEPIATHISWSVYGSHFQACFSLSH